MLIQHIREGKRDLRLCYDTPWRDGSACYTPRPYAPNRDDDVDANDELELLALSMIVR